MLREGLIVRCTASGYSVSRAGRAPTAVGWSTAQDIVLGGGGGGGSWGKGHLQGECGGGGREAGQGAGSHQHRGRNVVPVLLQNRPAPGLSEDCTPQAAAQRPLPTAHSLRASAQRERGVRLC